MCSDRSYLCFKLPHVTLFMRLTPTVETLMSQQSIYVCPVRHAIAAKKELINCPRLETLYITWVHRELNEVSFNE